MSRPVTPHAPVEQLIAGEFRRGPGYTNWRPHGTPDWLLVYTAAGAGRIATADGQVWTTAPGDLVLYEPRAHQDYGTAAAKAASGGTWRLRWSHFHPRPHWLPWLQWPVRARGLRWLRVETETTRRHLAAALSETVRWHERREIPGQADLAANALERALLWAHSAQVGESGRVRLDERVRRAAEWLGGDMLRQPFSLARLAARCGLSVSRLAHLFKAQMGVSPQQFAERRRLERACQLLRYTGLSIGDIAADTGFESAFYFSKRFRLHLGRSPTGYRESADQAPDGALPISRQQPAPPSSTHKTKPPGSGTTS